REPAEISSDSTGADDPPSGVVIRGGQVALGLGCARIARVDRPRHSHTSTYRRAWTQAKIPVNGGITGACDRGRCQNSEGTGRAKGYCRFDSLRVEGQEHKENRKDKSR